MNNCMPKKIQFRWNRNFYFKRTIQNDTRNNRKTEYPYISFKENKCDNKNFPIKKTSGSDGWIL